MAEMANAQNAGFYDSEIDSARGRCPTTLAAWCEESLSAAVLA